MQDSESTSLVEAKRYEGQERFDLALEEYEKAISLRIGDQALAHQGKGRALSRLGRIEEAAIECQEALKLNPELPLAHGVLGYVYRLQAKDDLAEKEFLTALQLDPDNPITLTNLANLYFNLRRYQEAAQWYEQLLQVQPKNVETQMNLALCYINQATFQKSITQLNSILRTTPTKVTTYVLYTVIPVYMVTHYFGRLNALARMGVGLGLYLVALLLPPFVSIPVGILLSIFLLMVVLINLWGIRYRGIAISIFVIFMMSCACLAYWFAIWIHSLHEALKLSNNPMV